jgi:tight adherence protein B
VIGLLLAVAGAYGVFLLFTAVAFRWTGVGFGPAVLRRRASSASANAQWRQWLVQAGLDDVRPAEFVTVMALLFLLGSTLAFVVFGGVVPAVLAGGFAGTAPIASYRQRRARRLADAREAWPRMIEEIRLLTGSLGRSVPQALLDVGRRGPVELRPAFAAAEREWLLSTDFARTTAVLKARLADPTADAACETLLVAHEIGGSDVDRRLAALIEDRIQDVQGRKDAQAKQAGVRFARRFVLLVPLGMALAGLSIGTGRAAYQTALGQSLVALGLAVVVGCWVWAGRLLRLPEEERVFS